MCFGVTFEQGQQRSRAEQESCWKTSSPKTKNLPESAKRDLLIALITLKYTQSNSVCYAVGGQTIGVGAGQQSRIHCTRLAGNKADLWHLRQHPKVLALQVPPGPRAAPSATTPSTSTFPMRIAKTCWATMCGSSSSPCAPSRFTAEEKKAYLARVTGVSLGSDAFFPFGDNIERAHQQRRFLCGAARRLHPRRST